MRVLRVLVVVLTVLLALGGCGDEAVREEPKAAPASEPASEDPTPTESTPTDTFEVAKSADLTIKSPDGYELGATVEFAPVVAVDSDSVPDSCSDLISALPGGGVAKISEVRLSVEDRSPSGFTWPDNDVFTIAVDDDFEPTPDQKWIFCSGDEANRQSVDLSVGATHEDYLIWIAQTTPNEPDGDFGALAPADLEIHMKWTYDSDGGPLTPSNCPDLPDACILGPDA